MSKAKAKNTGPIIYAGPSLPNNKLNQYALFTAGALPNYVKELAKDPDFNYFLISPSKLGELNVKLKNKSSVESLYFNRLASKFKGVK